MVGITHILWLKVSHECHSGPHFFAEDRIKAVKEEAGTSALNQDYDKLQDN